MNMITYFIIIILTSLLSAFFINLADKWRIVEWLQMHGTELISKAANCRFCLSWWTNLLVSCVIAVATKDCSYLGVPFFSTIITRFFIVI